MADTFRILVVDDDWESRMLLPRILAAEGYEVRVADSGRLALASATAHPPDLMLLDIRMPDVNGFEVIRQLKACKKTQEIPVMLVSGITDAEERVEGLALGAVDFVSKPFQREELLARVRTHLELSRRRAGLEQQVAERTAELRRTNELLEMELAHRRRTEQALRESEARFRNLADTAPVGIWVTDADMATTFYNRNALKFVGLTLAQITKCGWKEMVHPDDVDAVVAKYFSASQSRCAFQVECRVRRADGEYRWVLNTGIPRFINNIYIGHIGTTTDITDLKRSHERILAAQKLESLGALAAGIAHDFNNLLGSIYAETDLALSEMEPDSPVRENVEKIGVVATRAAEIVNLLLAYAHGRRDGAMVELVDLSKLVEEMLNLMKPSLSKKASFKTRLARDLPPVWANASQIRQVVMNLLTNASEALEDRDGLITVSTEWIHIEPEAFTHAPGCLPEGDYARLEVSDTGCGMSLEARDKAFDPFFTTKFLGRGLGLATAQGIVRAHGGAIDVVSAPGKGSTFEVLLPDAGRQRKDAHRVNGEAAAEELSVQ